MTLEEFIRAGRETKLRTMRAYLDVPGFLSFYARYGEAYLFGGFYKGVLTLAKIDAEEPGKGAFTRLIRTLRERYPSMTIAVENVLEERFRQKLERLGFAQFNAVDGAEGTTVVASYALFPGEELNG